jgi:carbon-monoxide dehydrogenase medium subunit
MTVDGSACRRRVPDPAGSIREGQFMEIGDFVYHRPAGIGEACTLLAELGDDAHVLAGGTEVLVDLKQHTFSTRHLVSLRDIGELREIRVDDYGLHVGALATHGMIARSQAVKKSFPALAETALTLAAVQVRNRGTIGGNFCSAVPSADLPPICIAAAATVRLAGAGGKRTVPAEEFFPGPKQTVRALDELLIEILIPPAAWEPGSGARYHKFGLRDASALAVAGTAAWLRIENGTVRDCRIVLGAVHPTPLLAGKASASVIGKPLSADLIRTAGEIAAKECTPITDLRGSADYRRELVQVLTSRALEDAGRRAGR